MNEPGSRPHRRYNPLSGEWILVSPHRAIRPWQGQVEPPSPEVRPPYDPECYLCPGNHRAGGHRNPDYPGTFSFVNDFSALLEPEALPAEPAGDLLRSQAVGGICKVLCFSPRHDLTLARLPLTDVRAVVDLWCREFAELSGRPGIRYVQIFENRGDMMGASNPHPHGQVWAGDWVPDLPAREAQNQESWLRERGLCLLCEYLKEERMGWDRVVFENQWWTVLVPYWALWPFETLVLPRRHVGNLSELSDDEKSGLAEVLRGLGIRYDNLFQAPFPYSMGLHQAPCGEPSSGWHLHLHYLPPLLRSAAVRKFMVGYELLAMPQRDLTPETAAARLRDLPDRHYLEDQA